jgi:hypothetical protein
MRSVPSPVQRRISDSVNLHYLLWHHRAIHIQAGLERGAGQARLPRHSKIAIPRISNFPPNVRGWVRQHICPQFANVFAADTELVISLWTAGFDVDAGRSASRYEQLRPPRRCSGDGCWRMFWTELARRFAEGGCGRSPTGAKRKEG